MVPAGELARKNKWWMKKPGACLVCSKREQEKVIFLPVNYPAVF
jgi:hypothetical protein